MYKNILVPVLFDKEHDTNAAFLAARALADDGARFTVLHVIEAIPQYAQFQVPQDVLARARDHLRAELAKLAAALPGSEAALVNGHAGRTIVDYAKDHGIDCIVIASHVPGLENILLGSTADRVVRHAKCAVHVIR